MHSFLKDGGEMGALIRAHDWSRTPLGPPDRWPQSLRTAIRLMLNTRHPVYVFWGEAGHCFYNDGYRPSIGSERHPGSLGRPAREVWGEIWDIIGPQIEQVMAGRDATWHENQLIPITRNGMREDVYWTYSYGPIDDETAPQGVGGVLVMCTETTAQVTAAKKLGETDERLQLALSGGTGIGTWDWDVQSDRVVADARFARIYGVDPAKAKAGAPVAEFFTAIHPEDVLRVRGHIDAAVRSGEPFIDEYRLIQADGSIRWVRAEGRCAHAEDGTPRRFPGVAFDITERKNIDARNRVLIEIGDRLRNLEDPAEMAYATAEILGREMGVSRAGYGTIDSAAETITIERDWNAPGIKSLAGVLRFRDYGSYIEQLKGGETVAIDDAFEDPRTAPTAFALKAISAQAFINMPVTEQGDFVAIIYLNHETARKWSDDDVGFIRDIADRTRIAVERRRAEQELRTLLASLESQVASRTAALMEAEETLRQSQKMEAIGQLTGGVAHDFNNLLTIIRSATDFLRRRDLPDDRRRRYVDAISDTVDRASKLTAQLLAFARRQPLMPKIFDVGTQVESVTDLIRPLVGSRIAIDIQLADERCFAIADMAQFETSLVNFAVNARDAMDGEGSLHLRVGKVDAVPAVRSHGRKLGDFIAVSVTDSGSGIAPDKLEEIFEPFYTTKEVGKGTGLGLSQAFGFAKQSGGEIGVTSRLGEGSTFTIYLPQADPEAIAGMPAASHKAPIENGGGHRVLVVEDNDDVGKFSTELLQDLGYTTLWAKNGQEALNVLAEDEFAFDLVFSDVIMPGMNGVELSRTIRQRFPGLPIVLTSGYSSVLAENEHHGFELIRKPYSVEVLSRVLRKAIAARP